MTRGCLRSSRPARERQKSTTRATRAIPSDVSIPQEHSAAAATTVVVAFAFAVDFDFGAANLPSTKSRF